MNVVTIPKKFSSKDLVIIPREEYEKLLKLKSILPFFKPTRGELKVIARGRREVAKGKYTPWGAVKNELENLSNRSRKKTS